MEHAQRSSSIGWLDRSGRVIVGLAVFTVVGHLAAALLGTLLARWWPVPWVWADRLACALGVVGSFWWACRDRRPWYRGVERWRADRLPPTSNGWVDGVVRSLLGMCAGALGGAIVGWTVLVWLCALAVDITDDSLFPGLTAFVYIGLAALAGAFSGFWWFVADVPWLPGRRRPPRS